jgi:23S rRNA pseudouridine1911/1915/1917 synthase
MQEWKTVFENDDIIIIDKPCGLAVQAVDEDFIKKYKSLHGIELSPITRLDQPVSGLCLMGKNSRATAHYTNVLVSGKLYKSYVAVVEGHFPKEINKIETLLLKKGNKAVEDKKNGKLCTIDISSIIHLDRYSILRLTIGTGRFHQIRAQLSILGFPVKGDLKYHSKRSNKEGGIYLHCDTLKINIGDEVMEFIAPFPDDKPLYSLVNG